MFDIAIIGAGPAGATLARLLGSQYRVLLVDKRAIFPSAGTEPRGKCCGGLLAPDAQHMLSRFGLGVPKCVLAEPQLFVVRAIDLAQGIERYYQRFYVNMDRAALEQWLVSLVPPGVDMRFGCRLQHYEADADGVRLRLIVDGRPITETARLLVGADGAGSRVRRQFDGGPHAAPAYFAMQHWVEADAAQPYFSALFDPQITDYYCWTIPKGDRLLIGAALTPRADATARFALLMRKLPGLGFRFGRTVHREGAPLRRPGGWRHLACGDRQIALLGEAGDWISPSSAEGLSYALRTALALAEALRDGLDGFQRRYRRHLWPLAGNIITKALKARMIFSPRWRRLAMRSGLSSMTPYFGLPTNLADGTQR